METAQGEEHFIVYDEAGGRIHTSQSTEREASRLSMALNGIQGFMTQALRLARFTRVEGGSMVWKLVGRIEADGAVAIVGATKRLETEEIREALDSVTEHDHSIEYEEFSGEILVSRTNLEERFFPIYALLDERDNPVKLLIDFSGRPEPTFPSVEDLFNG